MYATFFCTPTVGELRKGQFRSKNKQNMVFDVFIDEEFKYNIV